jgi:hypothetical protein
VSKPQNVLVLRDIMCAGYVAGSNSMFFCNPDGLLRSAPSELQKQCAGFADVANEEMAARLQNNNGIEAAVLPSMFPFIGSYLFERTQRREPVVSLTERVLPWEVQNGFNNQQNSPAAGMQKYFPGGDAAYTFYTTGGPTGYGATSGLHLNRVHYGEDVRAIENMAFLVQGSANNGTCFVGPHRVFSPYSHNFQSLVPGQGHFGPDALPGVRRAPHALAHSPHLLTNPLFSRSQDARWRRGESVSLQSARNSMVSLESAAASQMVYHRRGTLSNGP